jgi:hypothetical protein
MRLNRPAVKARRKGNDRDLMDIAAENNADPEVGPQAIKDPPFWHRLNKALPIAYMHIPKTAGNSFAELISYASGGQRSNVGYDEHFFSSSVDITSFSTQNQSSIYRKRSSLDGKSFIGGHISLSTLLDAFPDAQLVTILREPVCRLLSNWVFHRTVPEDAYEGWSLQWKARCSLLLGPLKQFLKDQNNAHFTDNLALRMLLRPHPLVPEDGPILEEHDSELIQEAVDRLQKFHFLDILENPRLHSNFTAWVGEDLPSRRINETRPVPQSLAARIEDELTPEVFNLLKTRARLDLRLWKIVADQRLVEGESVSLRFRTIRRAIGHYTRLMSNS